MSEVTKDSAIKLFGKTISPDKLFSDASLSQHRHSSFASSTSLDSKDESSGVEEYESKKPEKIIPCPRCNSMDTKFCYFNNYNVNQPRHFCKQCQRYWTSGGTMRNVAVGSGRRKTKSAHTDTDTDTFLLSFYCTSPPSLLGKHSRDGWTTLGINDGVGMFRESKAPARRPLDDTALLLRANPAAFSRSLNFHERA